MFWGAARKQIGALAHFGETGVDERLALNFGYAGGARLTAAKCPHALACLRCSIRDEMAGAAHLLGERGTITMTAPWWACQRLTLRRDGQDEVVRDFPAVAEGYEYQLEEFARLLREGERESARMTLADSLTIMETLDAMRRRLGCGIRLSEGKRLGTEQAARTGDIHTRQFGRAC